MKTQKYPLFLSLLTTVIMSFGIVIIASSFPPWLPERVAFHTMLTITGGIFIVVFALSLLSETTEIPLVFAGGAFGVFLLSYMGKFHGLLTSGACGIAGMTMLAIIIMGNVPVMTKVKEIIIFTAVSFANLVVVYLAPMALH